MTDQLLTEKEAAAVLRLSPSTLTRWRWANKGPLFRKFGGAVRYAQSDLDAYVEGAR